MIKNELIRARVSKSEKEKYVKLAKEKDKSLSDLIREVLNDIIIESKCKSYE